MIDNLPHPKDLVEYAKDNGIALETGLMHYQYEDTHYGSEMCAVGLLAHMAGVVLEDSSRMEWWDLADKLAVSVDLLRGIESGFEFELDSVDTKYIDTDLGRGRFYGAEIRKLVDMNEAEKARDRENRIRVAIVEALNNSTSFKDAETSTSPYSDGFIYFTFIDEDGTESLEYICGYIH